MVSEGMASFLPAAMARHGRTAGVSTLEAAAANAGAVASLGSLSRLMDLQNRMRDILTAAARSNTSVYTWDPRGLPVFEFDLSEPGIDSATFEILLKPGHRSFLAPVWRAVFRRTCGLTTAESYTARLHDRTEIKHPERK